MATLRNNRKNATLNMENCVENSMNNLEQNTRVAKIRQKYIIQVAEKIEGIITKKLSNKFSRTKNRILGAFSRLVEFNLKPVLQGHSGSAPKTSQNTFNIKQGTILDDSKVDLHPETRVSLFQTLNVFDLDDSYDTVTGVRDEIP